MTFQKFADFSEWQCGASLRIERCKFRNGLRLADTRVEGLCSLAKSKFHAPGSRQLDFHRLRVGGLLDCSCVTASVGLNLTGLHTDKDVRFHSSKIRVWGSVENCAVDMERAEVGGSVYFLDGVRITGRIDLRAKVGWRVYFHGAVVTAPDHLMAVNMDAADVCDAVFFWDGTRVTGQIDVRAKVGGNVEFLGVAVTARDDLKAVNMERADVGGSVYFRDDARVTGRIDLRAKVGRNVEFVGATVTTRNEQFAVDMSATDVGGSVFFRGGNRVTGGIDLRARVGGQVEFDGTSILVAAEDRALRMDGAEVRGPVFILEGVSARGHLHFKGAKIGGGLIATRCRTDVMFASPSSPAVTRHVVVDGNWDMSFADVNGPVLLHGVGLCGRFLARHLTVNGDLDLCGSVLGVPTEGDRTSLYMLLDELREQPGSWPYAWRRFEFERTEVPVPLNATPDQFVAHRAIDLELAEIHGRLWVKRSRVLGTAYLEDATVLGEANFDGTDVRGDLVLRSAEIKGQVFADEREGSNAYPRVSGRVDLSFATVQQVDVKFDHAATTVTPEYLDLTGATVDSLRLSGTVTAKKPPFVVAEGMRFGTLDCDGLTVRGEPRRVSWADWSRFLIWLAVALAALTRALWLEGWFLAGLVGVYAGWTIWAAVLAWKRKRRGPAHDDPPRGLLEHLGQTYPFSRGYYVLVERKLREAGNDPDADEVFHMRRRRETRGPKVPDKLPPRMIAAGLVERWTRTGAAHGAWLRCLDFLMGFGVRPGRLVHLYIVLGLLNAAMFLSPRSVERPVAYVQQRTDSPQWGNAERNPSGDDVKEAMKENPWPSDGGVPDHDGDDAWSTGHALFMSLRVQVPVLTLVAENDWSPATRSVARPFGCRLFSYADYASIMMVINLILIPLIVAGLTGYLKK